MTDNAGTEGYCQESSTTVAECFIYGSDTIPASTTVSLELAGVLNPGVGTGDKLVVSTSSDTASVNSPPYNITAAQSVSTPSVAMTSTGAGACRRITRSVSPPRARGT